MSREIFEQYMHAFASIVSMENVGCSIHDHGREVCSIGPEQGWDPSTYFALHQRLLLKMLELTAGETRLGEFINRQLIIIEGLLKFQESMHFHPIVHLQMIANTLTQRGNIVFYPWGTIDHQVYFRFQHTLGGRYTATIFDLGAGRSGERPIRQEYSPIRLNFETRAEFIEYLNQLITAQNQHPSVELYQYFYGVDRETCESCVPERMQTTGNCVVKNLLAVIRQDAIDCYGLNEGQEVFKSFFLMLLQATLVGAREYAEPFLTQPLPKLEDVCAQVQTSQMSFTGAPCSDILRNINSLYQQLNQAAIVPPQTLPRYAGQLPLWQPPRQQPPQTSTYTRRSYVLDY